MNSKETLELVTSLYVSLPAIVASILQIPLDVAEMVAVAEEFESEQEVAVFPVAEIA